MHRKVCIQKIILLKRDPESVKKIVHNKLRERKNLAYMVFIVALVDRKNDIAFA